MVDVRIGLRFGRAVRQRADKLFRRALAANGLFEVGEALDEEERRYGGHIEVVHQDRLVQVEALQRRFVENQRWPLGHMKSLCIRSEEHTSELQSPCNLV